MSKVIWIYSRKNLSNTVENKLREICGKISPDNIVPVEPKVFVNGKIAYGIINPKNTLLCNRNSLLLGV
ncbi:MAG: hypothetical protein ACOCV1_07600, partial [Bacillota bacterium]